MGLAIFRPSFFVLFSPLVLSCQVVIISSSQRPGKEVATSSQRKRVRSGNVPLAPVVPKGQTRWFGDSLAREFQQILRRIRELGMEFIFTESKECNLHMIQEFYANWASEMGSHYVTVRERNVPITPSGINDILGTPQDMNPLVLIGLHICPSYGAI
ncbi:hypothetical protein H5410_001899 [Solanum commersonii]|uniref:Uncharacterized protein n=1 Tax=Solanum commersonii TaxID=4109 RepID=A0A9J6B0C5_SOLCO|nr:hypothetical protein H5410_001899 [Solanum commersonii]